MKLRKTAFTKVKVKGSKPPEYNNRPTSYHEISIPDIYIKKAGWNKNDELSCSVGKFGGQTVLMLKNISENEEILEFKTFA